MPPGTYRVHLTGTGAYGELYYLSKWAAPVVTVTAGSLPEAQDATTVQLYRAR